MSAAASERSRAAAIYDVTVACAPLVPAKAGTGQLAQTPCPCPRRAAPLSSPIPNAKGGRRIPAAEIGSTTAHRLWHRAASDGGDMPPSLTVHAKADQNAQLVRIVKVPELSPADVVSNEPSNDASRKLARSACI